MPSHWPAKHFSAKHWAVRHWVRSLIASGGHWVTHHFVGQHFRGKHWRGTDPALLVVTPPTPPTPARRQRPSRWTHKTRDNQGWYRGGGGTPFLDPRDEDGRL